jgi:hypothetical protein
MSGILLKSMADDDHIETAIFVRFHDISIPQTPSPAPFAALAPMDVETVSVHGTTADCSSACCKQLNEDSLIDCAACLEQEWSALSGSVGLDERNQLQLILDTVTASGATGITKKELLVRLFRHRPSVAKLTISVTVENEIAWRHTFWGRPKPHGMFRPPAVLGRLRHARLSRIVASADMVGTDIDGTHDEDFPSSLD